MGIPNQLRQHSQVSSLVALNPPPIKRLVLQHLCKVDLELPAKKHLPIRNQRFSVHLKVQTKNPPTSSVDPLDWPLVWEAVCQRVDWSLLKRTHQLLLHLRYLIKRQHQLNSLYSNSGEILKVSNHYLREIQQLNQIALRRQQSMLLSQANKTLDRATF